LKILDIVSLKNPFAAFCVRFASGFKIRFSVRGFSWVVPDVAVTFVVEVGLVPAELTAYEAKWIEVN
jgi:hypothetical protein